MILVSEEAAIFGRKKKKEREARQKLNSSPVSEGASA